jgi:hypothetical protein
MKIELNKNYLTGLLASTDLHAGGIFFSIIYRQCLTFSEDGKVLLTKRVVDAYRPMDPVDVMMMENYKVHGNYYENDKGYIVCKFKEAFIELTGLPTTNNPNIISFHAHNSRFSSQGGVVYELEI